MDERDNCQTSSDHFDALRRTIVCVCATTIPIRELCREIVADGAIRPGRSVLSSTDDHRHDRPCTGIVSGASEARAWLGHPGKHGWGNPGRHLGWYKHRWKHH